MMAMLWTFLSERKRVQASDALVKFHIARLLTRERDIAAGRKPRVAMTRY